MAKKVIQKRRRRNTKSLPSLNTKKSREYTPTFESDFSGSSSGTKRFVAQVEGVSMWPYLRPGYFIKYTKTNPDHLEDGDILVISSAGRAGESRTVVHRMIRRVGPYFLEAGDNSFSASLVHSGQILGRVTEVFDQNKKPVKLSKMKLRWKKKRFILFSNLANSFLFLHEMKDRTMGHRKSFVLWKASEWYRSAWKSMGIQVPLIPPR